MQRPVQLLPDAQLQKTPGSRISVREHTDQPGKRKDRRAVGIKLPDTFAASASEANTEADSDNRDACRTAFGRDWQAEAHGSPSRIPLEFTRGFTGTHCYLQKLVFSSLLRLELMDQLR